MFAHNSFTLFREGDKERDTSKNVSNSHQTSKTSNALNRTRNGDDATDTDAADNDGGDNLTEYSASLYGTCFASNTFGASIASVQGQQDLNSSFQCSASQASLNFYCNQWGTANEDFGSTSFTEDEHFQANATANTLAKQPVSQNKTL